jgi:GxxExxY protein
MRLTGDVINCAVKVHRNLGSGFFQSVYESALAYEFSKRGIEFERQPSLEVWYEDHLAGKYIADFIVEGKLLVELKALSNLNSACEAQLLNYLKATRLTIGLILNFGTTRLQIKRRVRNYEGF